jgi:hypothetical protein
MTMTDLSPAAQQVFWEFNRVASGKPDDWHYLPAIAAALRAAVDQLGYSNVPEEFADLRPFVVDADDLLAIAAELEGNA